MDPRTEALIQTAWHYREGENVEKNLELAIQLYNRAIQIAPEYSRAYYGLGWCYFDVDDMDKNFNTWFPLFQKAAMLGYPAAQYDLAYYYESNKMFSEALKWYEMAANQDDTDAILNMSRILLWEEDFAAKDYPKAFRLMHKAYELKADWAALELGLAYYDCPDKSYIDYDKSIKYFKESALRGDGLGAFFVAQSYKLGRGVPQNLSDAIVWLKFAADHGDEDSIKSLAVYYSYPEKNGFVFSKDDTVAIIEKATDESCAFCYSMMQDYDNGKYGTIDHDKANHFCSKFYRIRGEKEETDVTFDAKEQLIDLRNLRSMNYAATFAKWSITPDSDIEGKKALIKEFEENIEKRGDLNSLKTLACIYAGMNGIKRYNCPSVNSETGEVSNLIITDAPAEQINSLPVEGILDYKKAFELLEKGIKMGDPDCDALLKTFCERFSKI